MGAGDNGDGVREVPTATMGGAWAGLRHVVGPFQGVSQWHLAGYVAMFGWRKNL